MKQGIGTALGIVSLLGFGLLASLYPAKTIPPMPPVADSSIGLPVPAWITPDGNLKVYVGSGPNRRLLVNRGPSLNVERAFWTDRVVSADGFAILPIENTPRIRVREEQSDGTYRDVVPGVNTADMARGR